MAELKISQMTQATEEQLTDGALMEVAVEDGNSSTGYSTKSGSLARLKKYAIGEVADELLANQNGGWARKNLVGVNINTLTNNGVVFTVNKNTDGTLADITLTGASTLSSTITQQITDFFTLPAGTYIANGTPSNAAANTCRFRIRDRSNNALAYVHGSPATFTLTQPTDVAIQIQVAANYALASPFVFYPMIRPATIEDGTYVPYAPSNSALNADLANSVLFQNNINIASMITMESGFTLSSARAVLYGKRLCQLYIVVKTANALSVGTEYNFGTLASSLRSPVLCPLVSTDLVGIINNGGSFRGRPIVAKAANSSLYLSAICILANEYSG